MRPGQSRGAFFVIELRPTQEPAEVAVALLRFGQQHQVALVFQRHLGPDDGVDAALLSSDAKADRCIQAMMIGEAQRAHAQLSGAIQERLGGGRSVQQRETGVCMQLDILAVHG